MTHVSRTLPSFVSVLECCSAPRKPSARNQATSRLHCAFSDSTVVRNPFRPPAGVAVPLRVSQSSTLDPDGVSRTPLWSFGPSSVHTHVRGGTPAPSPRLLPLLFSTASGLSDSGAAAGEGGDGGE